MAIASDIIIIGGSAGSYTLIAGLLEQLPFNFEAAICIVLHRNRHYDTKIEKSLSRKLNKNIIPVIDKMDICKNNVYFAPAGYHLLIEPNNTFSLDCSEHINYSRPSIDVLFETAAQVYAVSCTAFLLLSANGDDAKGLRINDKYVGKIIIQYPAPSIIRTVPLAGTGETISPTVWKEDESLSIF